MKNLIICLVCFLYIPFANAQINYSFTTSGASFDMVTNGTTPMFTGNGTDPLADEGFVNYIPIGFSFSYNNYSNTYNEVAISSNGFISLTELSDSYVINNLNNGASGERPIIAPLWDDLDLSLTSNLTYTTTGSAPNRVFTVQWLNVNWGFGSTSAAISFQLKLYETSNWIEFIYRPEAGFATSPSASIGLTALGTGTNNFVSIGGFSLTPSVSVSSESNNITAKPNNVIKYTFKPGVLPVKMEYFTVTKDKEKHILKWQTVQETNHKQFNIQRSNNGVNFSNIASQPSFESNGNSKTYLYADTKPLIGNNYYRLQQIDVDGKTNYSSIVYIKNVNNNWASLNIYPNPVVNNLQVNINTHKAEKVNISVTDISNTVLLHSVYYTQPSENLYILNVQNLAKGTYFIKVYNSSTEQFIVQKFIKN
ncbi:MAG TPA: T9SS type A sorting domain-containing protein [Chitinophagaceae bacterium]|nr:T9SS type A sorting domain-containing protein [Chitinophagaceae bacterium]HMZ45999.1 T9SS type A sorting domain-containing protein [Chitinophagaceae bacterium]HNF29405.1 T9SS type A sorting domain-containing protein [Chitinophagaceae bacterium]HNJ57842.1 T9SS type A sorting domain-containing protein [Chitinophagaceae bacterium]HNL82358.1 T9SS type A sorting domain-containing protein [Chitinophagaceae bacterium]